MVPETARHISRAVPPRLSTTSPPHCMGKQGPCCHCNISMTPLWRNGPPEKPVLCNACGSRWRTKGTLLNYMPMHSGGFGVAGGHEGSEDAKCAFGRQGAHKHSSEPQSHKRKEPCGSQKSWTPLKRKETVITSASGLEVGSSSESASLTTEPTACGSLWEGPVPTKRRTVLFRSHALSDKVGRHLLDYYFVNLQQATCSQLVVCRVAEARTSGPLMQLPNGAAKNLLVRGKEKVKQITRKMEGGSCLLVHRNPIPNKTLLENFPYKKRDVLHSCQSPLVLLEMKDIVNFDTFTGLLTEDEQSQLMKFVSSVDVLRVPDSLKGMFNSAQFEGAFSNFQQLLSEGMFDSLELGQNLRVLQHFQKLLSITDLSGSGWMERCSQLQHRSKRQDKSADFSKIKGGSKENMKGFGLPVSSSSTGSAGFNCSPAARLPTRMWGGKGEELMPHAGGSHKQNGFAGNLSPLPTHGTVAYGGSPHGKHPDCTKVSTPDIGSSSTNGVIEPNAEGTCFISDGRVLADHGCGGGGSIAVDGSPHIEAPWSSDSTERDLLFHIPPNMMFQQAELLHQPTCKEETSSNQQVVESESLIISNTWRMDSCCPRIGEVCSTVPPLLFPGVPFPTAPC